MLFEAHGRTRGHADRHARQLIKCAFLRQISPLMRGGDSGALPERLVAQQTGASRQLPCATG